MEKLKQELFIHSYECGADGKLRLLTLFNVLQNIADLQAEKLGIGYQHLITKNLAWVGASYSLAINKAPAWGEKLIVSTWPSDQTAVSAIRDFQITDLQGNPYILATSQWVVIDRTSGRPQIIKKHLPETEILPERALACDFRKLEPAQKTDFTKHFYVRYDDIDLNKHVNNAIYPVWASEAVPNEWRENYQVAKLSINFRSPAFYGDEILVETQMQDLHSIHHIYSIDKTKEFARIHIDWQRRF